MTDQPKPTPYFGKNWRVSSHGIFNGTMRIAKFDFDTDPSDEVKQAMYSEILALLCAPELQQRVDELEFVYKMSEATNDALRKDNASLLDDNVRIAQERGEATEALEQYALRTNQQIDGITQKLDTFTADNQRLRQIIEKAIRLMSQDDGEIDWNSAGELLNSYAAAFDPHGLREDNQRLRELLRRVDEAASSDDWGSIGVELLEQIKHAIGRTGE